MKQHPMAKAYIAAFAKNGGKEFKARFNPYSLDQQLRFGPFTFRFRIRTTQTTPSWDAALIPRNAQGGDVIMIQEFVFVEWQARDAEYCEAFDRFMAIVATTSAAYE